MELVVSAGSAAKYNAGNRGRIHVALRALCLLQPIHKLEFIVVERWMNHPPLVSPVRFNQKHRTAAAATESHITPAVLFVRSAPHSGHRLHSGPRPFSQ